ncbi:MAG TPA: response regulator [Dongiaceae bacterium]|nr:response regulator [Dongiaceae bacterium]
MGELSELVYLVDDEPPILKALGRLLKSSGFETRSFLTARAFLEAYDPQRPACLILDLELPDISGLELQRTLRDRGSTHPIVFLSGHADVARSVSAMKNGAVDFLTKPVPKATLLTAVRNAIKRSRTDQASSQQLEHVMQRCSQLTRRECEVVDGMASGLLNKQIAANLGIVEKTVKVHRARAISKLGCRSSFELLRLVNGSPGILPLTRTFDGVPTGSTHPTKRRAPLGAVRQTTSLD